MGLLFLLIFKHNLCNSRGTFCLNKNIRDFSLNSGGFQKPLFDRFVVCNLSVYLLGLALANACFRPALTVVTYISMLRSGVKDN